MGQTPSEDNLPAEVLALDEPRIVFRGNKRAASDCFMAMTLGSLFLILLVGFALYGAIRSPEQVTGAVVPLFSAIILGNVCLIVLTYLRGRAILGLRYVLCPAGLARVRGMRVDVLSWKGWRSTSGRAPLTATRPTAASSSTAVFGGPSSARLLG